MCSFEKTKLNRIKINQNLVIIGLNWLEVYSLWKFDLVFTMILNYTTQIVDIIYILNK